MKSGENIVRLFYRLDSVRASTLILGNWSEEALHLDPGEAYLSGLGSYLFVYKRAHVQHPTKGPLTYRKQSEDLQMKLVLVIFFFDS